ncbi:MAG: hypothetical protein HBSAPP03_09500 [Phycisphaerae bacterium]|nr:MAG: hypothetical protein HBSAPP03_09500 [Phycisphaerae bacterium]
MSEHTPAPAGEVQHSKVSRKWTLKMVAIAVFLAGFGLWGLYDATVAYPRRGERASEYLEFQYLENFKQARPPLDHRAGIADPANELQRLRGGAPSDLADRAAKTWLESLVLIGRLDGPTATSIPRTDFRGSSVADAETRRRELEQKFTTGGQAQAPSPLSKWDIPVQWIITAAGLGLGLWMLLLIIRVRTKSFAFEPGSMRLTLPGGASFTPADIEDVDKRKWHKFYVTVKIKPGHGTLGGKDVELDLLRYEPVEEWVLAMERAAFPDRVEQPPPEEPAPSPADGPAA